MYLGGSLNIFVPLPNVAKLTNAPFSVFAYCFVAIARGSGQI